MQTWDDMKAEHILCRQVIPGKGNSYFGPRQNASCEIGFTQLIIMINSLSELIFFFYSKPSRIVNQWIPKIYNINSSMQSIAAEVEWTCAFIR